MNKRMIKLKIQFTDVSLELALGYLNLDKPSLEVAPLMEHYETGCLISSSHGYQQTQFILTGADPCWLVEFNERKEFVTIKVCANSKSAPISYLISEPYVIILTDHSILPSEPIRSMVITDYA